MTLRIHHGYAIIFSVAALLSAESTAFAATRTPNSNIHKPITATNKVNLSSARRINTKQTISQLRAGASSTSNAATIPPPQPPTNGALLKFYFPCLCLWISGPLLSLVDTSFIGLSAKAGAVGAAGSAAQLAALGPATTFIDGSLYLFAFLNVATTNLYASALARGGSEKKNKLGNDELPGEGVVRTAAKTSLYSGIGLMFFLLAVARPLIALYIGK